VCKVDYTKNRKNQRITEREDGIHAPDADAVKQILEELSCCHGNWRPGKSGNLTEHKEGKTVAG
jgi:hypothetical protein